MRGVRVFTLAAVVVGLSAVSHHLAGGARPGAVPLAVVTVLSAAAVSPLTRRELGLPRLLGVLGAGQVGLHLAFERVAELAPAATSHHHGASSHVWVLGAHAVATLAVALVLRHGEALLWRLGAWLTERRLPGDPRVPVLPAAPAAAGSLPALHAVLGGNGVRARAPPVTA